MLFDMEKYIYSESLVNTLYIELRTNVTKFSSEKINVTNALFFLSRAPTHHSFTQTHSLSL